MKKKKNKKQLEENEKLGELNHKFSGLKYTFKHFPALFWEHIKSEIHNITKHKQ